MSDSAEATGEPPDGPPQIASTSRCDLAVPSAEASQASDLRLRVCTSTFKLLVLGDGHEPDKTQTRELLDELAKAGATGVSDKTWQAWYLGRQQTKTTTIKALDTAAQAVVAMQSPAIADHLPADFFSALVRRGLLDHMMRKIEVQPTPQLLSQRAFAYDPRSAIHLHVDSIEAAGWISDLTPLPWSTVKAIAGRRILAALHDRWSRRTGSIYATLDSPLKLELDGLDQKGRDDLRRRVAEAKPDRFYRLLREGASPAWHKCLIEPDCAPEHVYKTLFRIAADPEFLRADRLEAWALDLATAALAMFSVAWADRLHTFGPEASDELTFWAAFEQLLFQSAVCQVELDRSLNVAAYACGLELTEQMHDRLMAGRATFQAVWRRHGGHPSDARSALDSCMETYPLRLVG